MSKASWIVCALVLASLGACGSASLFRSYEVPESADVEDAPWPRLVEVPPAPKVGEYSAAVPDPAKGVALELDFAEITDEATRRAETLSQPVLTEDQRAKLRP